MTVVVAVAVTAIVVGVAAVLVTARLVRSSVNQAIGGRPGNDPVDEHRRMVVAAKKETAAATTRSDILKLSLDALTSGVIVTDHAGKVVVRNRLASEIPTRSHEKALLESTAAELLAKAVQGTAVEREIEVYGPPQRILFVNAVPITASAQVVGALAVIEDISDHHRIEKTRRDFVANLSHELRTPIGAVSLLAEMLVDEEDPDTRAHLSDRMLLETDRMSDTIDALLELSRIESDGEVYDEVVSIKELIEEAVERTRVLADAHEIEVGAMAPASGVTITGNRGQLSTALLNLVENAVKYSSPGDTVSVRARVEDDTVALIVQDTGRGIPARDLDRVFERFYRVDRSRDASTGGTGIGLSIVRHVAINHGGTVSVDSFEGEGSTFTMVLPLEADPDVSPQPLHTTPDGTTTSTNETAGEVGC